MKAKQVINGTWGEAWIDGSQLASIEALEAIIEFEHEDINQPRKLSTGKKMVGWEGSGTLSFKHINSQFIILMRDDLKEGKQTEVDIITKLDDPDALGAERMHFKNVTFEDLPLANWEAKSPGELEVSFFFDDWEPLDLIED